MTTMHVMPVGDLVEHVDSEDCVCGPEVEPVPSDDGFIIWLVVHHSLDGCEQNEQAVAAADAFRELDP